MLLNDVSKTLGQQILEWGPWIFNLGLVIVGALQVFLLKVTWKAMQIQTKIQEFGNRPWLELGIWTLSRENPRTETGQLKKSLTLQYRFLVVNRTKKPIHLENIVVRIRTGKRKYQSYQFEGPKLITPFSPIDDSTILCLLPIRLGELDVVHYSESRFLFSLTGDIQFLSPTGEIVHQQFRRAASCGPTSEEVYVYLGTKLRPIELKESTNGSIELEVDEDKDDDSFTGMDQEQIKEIERSKDGRIPAFNLKWE
jgi:hypothetical protein